MDNKNTEAFVRDISLLLRALSNTMFNSQGNAIDDWNLFKRAAAQCEINWPEDTLFLWFNETLSVSGIEAFSGGKCAASRARIYAEHILISWRPPVSSGNETPGLIAQTVALQTIAFVLGELPIDSELSENQRLAIESGVSVLQRDLLDPRRRDAIQTQIRQRMRTS